MTPLPFTHHIFSAAPPLKPYFLACRPPLIPTSPPPYLIKTERSLIYYYQLVFLLLPGSILKSASSGGDSALRRKIFITMLSFSTRYFYHITLQAFLKNFVRGFSVIALLTQPRVLTMQTYSTFKTAKG